MSIKGSQRSVQGGVALMGEMVMISNGIATTFNVDGSITREVTELCDSCNTHQPPRGGLSIQVVGGEEVIWLCSQCRG
jgi:hypothetical protein